MPGQQRRHRIGLDHPGACGVQRGLRAGHVGDAHLEAAAQLGGRHPRPDGVERRRREAGDAGQPVGGHAAPGLLVRLEGVGHLVQPHDRAGLADGQVDEVGRDHAAQRGRLQLLVDHRDGHDHAHLPQAAERLGAGHQPGPQTPGDRRQDHVVDGAVVGPADELVVGQVGVDGDHPALLGERSVDGRGLLRPATGEGAGDAADPLRGLVGGAERGGGRGAQGLDQRLRHGHGVLDGVQDQPGGRPRALGGQSSGSSALGSGLRSSSS